MINPAKALSENIAAAEDWYAFSEGEWHGPFDTRLDAENFLLAVWAF